MILFHFCHGGGTHFLVLAQTLIYRLHLLEVYFLVLVETQILSEQLVLSGMDGHNLLPQKKLEKTCSKINPLHLHPSHRGALRGRSGWSGGRASSFGAVPSPSGAPRELKGAGRASRLRFDGNGSKIDVH